MNFDEDKTYESSKYAMPRHTSNIIPKLSHGYQFECTHNFDDYSNDNSNDKHIMIVAMFQRM